MLIRSKPGWELPESAVTPEEVFIDRRRFIKGAAAGSLLAAGAIGVTGPYSAFAATAAPMGDDPSADLYPVPRNAAYTVSRPLSDEEVVTEYNNFYEFGSHKEIAGAAQALQIRPWTVTIDGLVEKPFEIGIDDLLARMPLEERIYRHRCVEAWAMTVPWSGFAFTALLDLARPLAGAKYVEMKTFLDPKTASGQKQSWYPWPYTEGLTMAEAANELAFLVTGLYGKPVAKQNGAPLRLAVPWKYGFKSVKSITRFTFTDKQPMTFWEALGPREYGFWANVNPDVAHPRWSQATERLIGTRERVATRIYNGYGEYVAQLYAGMQGERLFI